MKMIISKQINASVGILPFDLTALYKNSFSDWITGLLLDESGAPVSRKIS